MQSSTAADRVFGGGGGQCVCLLVSQDIADVFVTVNKISAVKQSSIRAEQTKIVRISGKEFFLQLRTNERTNERKLGDSAKKQIGVIQPKYFFLGGGIRRQRR